MTDINKLVKQFKIDIPRLHVGVSLPHLKMSITSCPSNEEGIIEWWLLHFSEKSSETLQKLLYQINTKKEIPFSFQRCLYWCTQTSLADYYTDFYYTHNMDESGHHLIDNNNSSSIYHVIFADDKHIYIKKSFRESYFNKNGNEVIVCYWTLYIKVFPAATDYYVTHRWEKNTNLLNYVTPLFIGSIAAIALFKYNRT